LCFRALAAAGLLLGCLGAGPALAAEVPVMGPAEVRKVVPVGKAVGIKLFSDGVLVVGFSQIPAAEGSVVPARQCGLKEGDIITHINAAEVDTVEEVQEELKRIGGKEMSIRALRDGKTAQVTAQAVKGTSTEPRKFSEAQKDRSER